MIQLLANLFTAQEAIYKIKKQKDNASSSFTNLLRTSNSSNTQIIPFYEELNTKLKKHHYTRMLGLILRENYQHKALVQYFPVSEALYETLCQLNVPKRPGYDEFNFTETKKPDIKSGPTR